MLSDSQKSFYADNGYVLLEGMFSRDEAASYRREAHALIQRFSDAQADLEATWESARSMVGTATRTQLFHRHNVEFYSAAFTRLLIDERLTSAAATLMRTENIQLHHTKLFIKPPEKGSPFPMHQDHPFFPHRLHSMTAAIVHFDDAPVEKGCVCIVPGSHKGGPIEHQSPGSWHLPFETYPLESAVPCPAKAGDVLLFSYLTIHGSGVNVSEEARTTLLIQMRDAADSPQGEAGWEPGQGLMLRGVAPAVPQGNR